MTAHETEIKRSLLGAVGGALGAVVAAGISYAILSDGPSFGGVVGAGFLALMAIAGIYHAFTAGSAPCPWCGKTSSVPMGSNSYHKCVECGEYREGTGNRLGRTEKTHVAEEPRFSVGLQPPGGGIFMSPSVSAAVPMKSNKTVNLELKWPKGCCVCGKPAKNKETIKKAVSQDKMAGVVQSISTIELQIPHCGEHSGGAALDISAEERGLSIKFRSYAYRNKFRDLNP